MSSGDDHEPSVPPGCVEHPAKILENIFNVAASDSEYCSANTQWCLQQNISHPWSSEPSYIEEK